MKIKLVLQPGQFSSFTSWYLEPIWREYFDIEIYDEKQTYDRASTLFVLYALNYQSAARNIIKQGYRVVVDYLWEFKYPALVSTNDILFLDHEKWFWTNESLWWQKLNYHNYQPNKQIDKLALMQIRRLDYYRDQLVKKLEPKLDQFLYSHRDNKLPDDLAEHDPLYQRYFNPKWYDSTWMSLTVESSIENRHRPFITEKTCKPLAFCHPFMIVGNPGSIAKLRSWGFATFDNLFDESYDDMLVYQKRLDKILKNLDSVTPGHYDKETQQRLEHNRNHYFDNNLVSNGIVDIVTDILEFVELK